MRKIVLDTNVVVSGFHGGRPRELLAVWTAGRALLCVSEQILEEYREVLGRFSRFAPDTPAFFARLRDLEHVVHVTPVEAVRAVDADPDDDIFLACAVAAEADLIVSGDHHLLDLGEFRGIPIVRPAEALELLEESREAGGGEEPGG